MKKVLTSPSSMGQCGSEPFDLLRKNSFEIINNPYGRKLTEDEVIDLEKDYPGGSRNHIRYFENAVKLFDVPADAMLLNNTGELKIHPSQPKITLAVYTTYNDEKIYIDTKLLANFENYTTR